MYVSAEVVDAMQRFYPFHSSGSASSLSPMSNSANIISKNNECLITESMSRSGSQDIQPPPQPQSPFYHWQDGSSRIIRSGTFDGKDSNGIPGGEEKFGAGSDEESGGSSGNDLMDLDIISFDDQQIYLDDQSFSRRDHGGSYDTDSEDGLETCGVSGSTACVSAGAMGVGTLQNTAAAAMGAVFNWRDGHRLNADGINIQESEDNPSIFDFDQCCFINPFEWGGSSSNSEAERRSRRRQSNKAVDVHSNDPSYSAGVFGQSEHPDMSSSSSRRGMRAAVSTVTSTVCSGLGADSQLGSACGCGTLFCGGGCSSFRHSPLSMHYSLQETSSSAPNYVLYSNPSLYSLNDSMEAVTELQESAASNTGFGFGFGSIGDTGGTPSLRPSSLRAAPAATEGVGEDPQQQQQQQQQQSESTSATRYSQWKPNFSSYSSSASSMASYFWSNSLR